MPHVIVAGAGIGGLTAALALAKGGVRVTLLERAAALEAIGAGVQLSPNATRILGRLDLLESLQPVAFRPSGIRVRSARSGRTLALLTLAGAEQRWHAPYLVVHRADLQRVLAEHAAAHANIELHLGTALAGFGTSPDGVSVAARQGLATRAFAADALVGADGVRSSVRARLVAGDADMPLETGRTAWRGLAPADAVDPLFRAGETGLWLGPRAHLVHYPVQGGSQINIVVITEDTSSAGGDLWARPGDAAIIGARVARWSAAVRALIAATPHWTTWPLFDRAPLAAWHAGPVALLGDAAHPILPFLAQGAAQAIEDAAALAEAVSTTRAPADAFARYSARRAARVRRVQETARRLGRIYHLDGVAALARDASMRLLGPERLLARYDWLYGPTLS